MVIREIVRMIGVLYESMKMHCLTRNVEETEKEKGVVSGVQVREGQIILFDIDSEKRLIHIGKVSSDEREELLTVFQHFASRMKQESGVQFTVV